MGSDSLSATTKSLTCRATSRSERWKSDVAEQMNREIAAGREPARRSGTHPLATGAGHGVTQGHDRERIEEAIDQRRLVEAVPVRAVRGGRLPVLPGRMPAGDASLDVVP